MRVGAAHVLRRWLSRGETRDPERLFLDRYASDGLRAPREERRALQRAAQHCLVCGLCSVACAEAGGRPPLDPRDAVLSGARLEVDVLRLGIDAPGAACGACRACEPTCPAGIPIASVQAALASLGDEEVGRAG
jgi:heterodisulfide reductase subunit C